jgi:fimbrial isopeptide formation D2 family protein/LPXTG-motif cell wall-anchored protein
MRETTKRSPQWRVAAALGALTLSLIGLAGAATPAHADDAFGNVDNTKSGSITIHKHQFQTGTPTQGSPASTTTLPNPISGVTFTVYRVPTATIDLTTSAGWTAAAALTPTCPPSGASSVGSQVTGADGSTTFNFAANAAVGVYIVCETDAPASVVDRAQPFVVTIPLEYKRASGTPTESWLYDVNVYPKNGLTSVTKTADVQAALGLGATATFPVTAHVSKIDSGSNYTHYWVQDSMPSQVTPAAVTSVMLGSTALSTPADYTVTTNGQLVTVALTQTALATLKSSAPVDLKVVFSGKVTTVSADGLASDTAYVSGATKVGTVTALDPVPTTTTGTPSNVVTQKWGDLKLHKVDAGSASAGLAGATFQVYEATDPWAATCTKDYPTGATPISVTSGSVTTNTFTTDSTGALTVAGLFVTDTQNGHSGALQHCYVLVETVAPAGFILPTGDAAKTAVAVKPGVTAVGTFDATVTNTRVTGVALTLPMTGSDGIVVFSIAGAALVALGLVVAALSRRRRSDAA